MQKAPYEKLVFYQNIVKIRVYTFKITGRLGPECFRLVSQMRDCARSAKQNVREGYTKDSALQFGNYLKITLGSLDELHGDYDDCFEDKLIDEKEYRYIIDLIDKTIYMIGRYLDSLYKMNNEGKWKNRWPTKSKHKS